MPAVRAATAAKVAQTHLARGQAELVDSDETVKEHLNDSQTIPVASTGINLR